jgi:hypothetical protein
LPDETESFTKIEKVPEVEQLGTEKESSIKPESPQLLISGLQV